MKACYRQFVFHVNKLLLWGLHDYYMESYNSIVNQEKMDILMYFL